jgi:hypothetical protein
LDFLKFSLVRLKICGHHFTSGENSDGRTGRLKWFYTKAILNSVTKMFVWFVVESLQILFKVSRAGG